MTVHPKNIAASPRNSGLSGQFGRSLRDRKSEVAVALLGAYTAGLFCINAYLITGYFRHQAWQAPEQKTLSCVSANKPDLGSKINGKTP